MFGVSGAELMVILLVGLIVLGPDRLPVVARKAGQVFGELRRVSSGFEAEVRTALFEAENPERYRPVVDPPDPTDQAQPSDPPGPTDQAVPTDPIEPSDPPGPTDQAVPTDPIEPTDQAQPSDPPGPTDRAQPSHRPELPSTGPDHPADPAS